MNLAAEATVTEADQLSPGAVAGAEAPPPA